MSPGTSGLPRRRALPGPVLLAAALAAGLFTGPLQAQEPGRITGIVQSERSLQPISEVQVYLQGTDLGTLTGANGRFVILNVPPGTYQVRAERIGFATGTQEVTVQAGQAANVDFSLSEEVLGLDEIVVTGTAGSARRREVGNSISQIDLSEVAEPVQSVNQILQSRAPGINVNQATGMAGSAAQIRLRGSVSVSQSNQPLIYVDGVRVRSEPYERNVPPIGFTGRSGNVTAGPLDDINPNDIERIEVIKGSAATTLYGTEAAAGVIQIFTKRGRSGDARWTMQIDQGVAHLRPFAPDVNPYINMDIEDENGDQPFLRNGYRQKYSMNVGGGGEVLQYFVSGSWEDNEGVLPLDHDDKTAIRGNFTFTPLRDLQVQWNTSYSKTNISNTAAGNNAHGITLNVFRAEQNYISSLDPERLKELLNQDILTEIDRFITGATFTYSPITNFSNRLTVGYDLAKQNNRNLRPFGFALAPNGILSNEDFTSTSLTLDYVGSYEVGLTEDLSTTLSFGGQSITNDELSTTAYGEDFPGPGEPDVDAGALTAGFERRLRVTTAGFFGQALFGFRDRFFLTVGARVDGNSAFGEDLGLETYPKVSGSWVMSDESFWPESWGTMKLRAAYGQSGRAPGAFDAVRTWDPVGYGGQPAFFPLNLGNPELGPERTSEIEVGFDAAFFDNRLSAEFTYYDQTTTDALFEVSRPPSTGFASSQLENVGELANSGIELNVNGVLIESNDWGLELGGNLYTNDSEVLDLGGAPPFDVNDQFWVEEGLPIMALRGRTILNPDEFADPIYSDVDHIYGPQQPTLTFGVNTMLRFPKGIELSARGEYQGGHYISDGASQNALSRSVQWVLCNSGEPPHTNGNAAYPLIDAGRIDELTAWQRGMCIPANFEFGVLSYPADFFKIRDLTLRVPITAIVPNVNNATLTLSGRNFYRWRNEDFPIFDPEMISRTSTEQIPSISEHIPPAAIFTASVRVVF